jgi:hypothetical protein
MMPTNVSHPGCAAERAGDTTTARSYRTSSAEHERIDLRHEFYWTRAFKLKSTMTTRGTGCKQSSNETGSGVLYSPNWPPSVG